MTFRKSRCDACGSDKIAVTRSIIGKKEVYDEHCAFCGNLLYGYSRVTQQSV